eukprot:UN05448
MIDALEKDPMSCIEPWTVAEEVDKITISVPNKNDIPTVLDFIPSLSINKVNLRPVLCQIPAKMEQQRNGHLFYCSICDKDLYPRKDVKEQP